jgi:hypothetical protein
LYTCIEAMARRRTNPVLEVLRGVSDVQWRRRYPAGNLRFRGACLRAFYHCHRVPGGAACEHGHFHLFVRAPREADTPERWTHAAALSMDALGQPLCWLAVNRWVSAGPWRKARTVVALIDRVEIPAGARLLERWIGAMLRAFRPEVATLLAQRDRALARLAASRTPADVLADRSVYVLAARPVDLLSRFKG